MATVHGLLQSKTKFLKGIQRRVDFAASVKRKRFEAAIVLQKYARGYLIRKYVAWLNFNATIIQCAFRVHQAKRKYYRIQLKWYVQQQKHMRHYNKAATAIQSLWRGFFSRRSNFCYRAYRLWLKTVTERGERRTAEAAEFRIKSRVDDLEILEDEARQWLAFVVFKLHHLLRTYRVAGVFSDPATNELTEFEKLLKAVHYKEYVVRLRRKYEEFVKKHKPMLNNKRLFPIIGYGEDYWYLTLPEMYELTAPVQTATEDTRHKALHHGPQHKVPFLWRKPRYPHPSDFLQGRGPYTPKTTMTQKTGLSLLRNPPYVYKKTNTPPPTAVGSREDLGGGGDAERAMTKISKDTRLLLYNQHYKPKPDVFDYVDFHINAVLARKYSIGKIKLNENYIRSKMKRIHLF